MKTVVGLYTAPAALKAALAIVAAEGIPAADAVVVSTAAPDRDDGVARMLRSSGVPRRDAAGYAEGVARGARLLVVRCPSRAAAPLATALNHLGAPELAELEAAWTERPELRYSWPDAEGLPSAPS